MTYEKAYELLKEHGQEHLLKFYDQLTDEEKESLLRQIEETDFSLCSPSNAEKTQQRGHFEPLGALEVTEIEKNAAVYEKEGLRLSSQGKVGAVLLAGGQGTRLGFNGPKGTFNVGVTRTISIFEFHIRCLLDIKEKCGTFVPLYIMTSDINNDATVEFFEKNDYFGYDKSKVTFFVQEMAPSTDFNGKIYLKSKSEIAFSPNGNGGWFLSMMKAGLADKMKNEGIEYLSAFSVDNVLQKINDPVFVGATALSGADVGAKVVRKAYEKEKVGVLCLEDGKPSIVEYYEMTEEMENRRNENGELAYNFGVILNYLFKLDKLIKLASSGKMPIHVVEKKIPCIDAEGNPVSPAEPNGYKYETLILDMIHLMDSCLSYEVVREKEFAPIKNLTGIDSLESARKLLELNGIEL